MYTCPMHPEVSQPYPGNCPKCGMSLEPELPTLEDAAYPELIDLRRRFIWSLPLTVMVATLAMMGDRIPGINPTWLNWIELVLTLPIVLWAGSTFFERAGQSLIHRSPNMWTLIGLGTAAAFLYSVVATLVLTVAPMSLSPGALLTDRGSPVSMDSSADRVARYFVLAVVAVSLMTLLGWGLFGPDPSWVHGLINAVAVLIIACPCALGLATLMSIMVASGRAATEGVLFRDAAAIENLRRVDTLVVDKTGTLTQGRPEFDQARALPGYSEQAVLQWAGSVDQSSEHPLAAAIVRAARARGLSLDKATGFESSPGLGVCATVRGTAVALGNSALMAKLGVPLGSLDAQAEVWRAQGASVMFLAIHGQAAGLVAVSDPIKANHRDGGSLQTGYRRGSRRGEPGRQACAGAKAAAGRTRGSGGGRRH